jgi:hypothetical protein
MKYKYEHIVSSVAHIQEEMSINDVQKKIINNADLFVDNCLKTIVDNEGCPQSFCIENKSGLDCTHFTLYTLHQSGLC